MDKLLTGKDSGDLPAQPAPRQNNINMKSLHVGILLVTYHSAGTMGACFTAFPTKICETMRLHDKPQCLGRQYATWGGQEERNGADQSRARCPLKREVERRDGTAGRGREPGVADLAIAPVRSRHAVGSQGWVPPRCAQGVKPCFEGHGPIMSTAQTCGS